MKTSFGTALMVAGLSLALGGNASAAANSCSAKYKAAKTAGTLGGQNYKSFKAAQCASDTSTPASAAASPVGKSDRTATAATASGPATFPSAIDAKYAKDTPGKGRMETCLDQYHANKASGGNGGMKWIQKGGGYYSACSKKLKG